MAVNSSRRPSAQVRKTIGHEISPGITRHCQNLEENLVHWLPSLLAMASFPLLISKILTNLPSASRRALADSNLLPVSPPLVVSRILARRHWAISRALLLPLIINKALVANLPLVTRRVLVDSNRLVIITNNNLALCQGILDRGNPTTRPQTRGSNPQILALCMTSSQDNLKPRANAGKETLNKIKVSLILVRIRPHSRMMGS